jgi:hypothetical protein
MIQWFCGGTIKHPSPAPAERQTAVSKRGEQPSTKFRVDELTSDNFHHKISSPGHRFRKNTQNCRPMPNILGIPGVELFCNASTSRVAVQKIKKFHKNNGF